MIIQFHLAVHHACQTLSVVDCTIIHECSIVMEHVESLLNQQNIYWKQRGDIKGQNLVILIFSIPKLPFSIEEMLSQVSQLHASGEIVSDHVEKEKLL